MMPIDIRNETWATMMDRVEGLRAEIYGLYLAYGPCTTRELAARSEVDLLTVRPRTTELVQIGLVHLTGVRRGEGVYTSVPEALAKALFDRKQSEKVTGQLQLF